MLKFCTLFNKNYLSRGLAMYKSLAHHCADFHLYIFAFDDQCFDILKRLDLKKATIVSLKEFENEELLSVKSTRTATEYCWTCSSSTIKYCIETFDLDHCTYIDADLLFFNDPGVLYDEMGDKSVLITPHRYTDCYDQSVASGTYCVQYMTFKNTIAGMTALEWWIDACLDWCYNRVEEDKFGDQKYLDDWETRFESVHVLKHLGGGVAPWNVQQYSFKNVSRKIKGKETSTGKEFDLIFYHYHGFQYIKEDSYCLTNRFYKLERNSVRHIYRPYIKVLSDAKKSVIKLNERVLPYEATHDIQWVKNVFGRYIVFTFLGYYKNYYKKRSMDYGFFSALNLF